MAASSVLLSLLPQIGEQVDYLRFLPRANRQVLQLVDRAAATGPGWMLIGGFKLLAGSFLAFLALRHGVHRAGDAADADVSRGFRETCRLADDGAGADRVFVIVSQLKINVTNAYAGSIAWSNFFSRLTHSHPGRVVWLVFNVVLALLLMEIGIFKALERRLLRSMPTSPSPGSARWSRIW
jgi:purine-cytosine permease-like protein